jgi:hypothetical protein
MLFGSAAHMLRRRKEAAVHHWMSLIDLGQVGLLKIGYPKGTMSH